MPVLGFHTADGKNITLNARRESTVIMQDNDLAYTFDSSGRFLAAFRDGKNYRRSFSNEILEKQSGPRRGVSGRLRRSLTPDEVRELEVEAYQFAGTVSMALRAHAPRSDTAALQAAEAALAQVNTYCFTSLERERELYGHIYHPVTIMPPDQYLALYLQMTEGCSFNECTFCSFYKDRRFRIKHVEEFREHIRRVRAFMGKGLLLRRSIFLGDANALMIPHKLLLPRFDVIHQEFDLVPNGLEREARSEWQQAHPIHFDGIYSFIDAFTTKRKRAHEFAELAERGLRRVYVGLESGDADLLKFLGKPNTPEEVARLVAECKEGGVAVGIIILVGAGGAHYARAHMEHTIRLVQSLGLNGQDIIYLSELVDFPDSTYSQRAAALGIEPLETSQVDEQMQILRDALMFRNKAHSPQVACYDVREFVY